MQTITWVEKPPQVQRNTPARCLQLQRAKLAEMNDYEEGQA